MLQTYTVNDASAQKSAQNSKDANQNTFLQVFRVEI